METDEVYIQEEMFLDESEIHVEMETTAIEEELVVEEECEVDGEGYVEPEGDIGAEGGADGEVIAEYVFNSNTIQKFTWTPTNTKRLIKGYYDRRYRFKDQKVKNSTLWEEISQEWGFGLGVNALSVKWRNLKKTYTMILEKMYDGMNSAMGYGQSKKWEHFEIFDLLYATDETEVDKTFLEEYFANLDVETISTEIYEDETSQNETTSCYKFEWSPSSVKILVKGYLERRRLFNTPKVKKKNLWHEIALELKDAGFQVDEEAIDTKWRNLKFKYRNLKKKLDLGALEQGITWEYFDLFDQLNTDESKVDLDYVEEYFSKLVDENENDNDDDVFQLLRNGDSSQIAFAWCPQSTDVLIRLYSTRKDAFRDPKIRRRKLWNDIWKEMIYAGFPIEHKHIVNNKMRNLRKTYRDYKRTKGSGPIKWSYYDRLDAIFGDEPEDTREYSNDQKETQYSDADDKSEVNMEDEEDFVVHEAPIGVEAKAEEDRKLEVVQTAEKPCENPPYKWCPRSTKFFLKCCLKRKKRVLAPSVMKDQLWSRIMEEMNSAGFSVTNIKDLQIKMENLTKTYKNIKEKNKKAGNGRGLIRWEHLPELDNLYADEESRPGINRVAKEKPPLKIKISPSPVASPVFELSSPSPERGPNSPLTAEEKRTSGAKRMSNLWHMRKKQLLVEEKKAQLTEKVYESLNETNKLLRERNQLLRKLVNERIKSNK